MRVNNYFQNRDDLIIGTVDISKNPKIVQRFGILVSPTIHLFKNHGKIISRYSGIKSEQHFIKFIELVLNEEVMHLSMTQTIEEWNDLLSKRDYNLIGFFENNRTKEFREFKKMASQLKHIVSSFVLLSPHYQVHKLFIELMNWNISINFNEILLYSSFDKNVKKCPSEEIEDFILDNSKPLIQEVFSGNWHSLKEEGKPLFLTFLRSLDDEMKFLLRNFSLQVKEKFVVGYINVNKFEELYFRIFGKREIVEPSFVLIDFEKVC